eukprot:927678-Karenia_brevis.AAC.1
MRCLEEKGLGQAPVKLVFVSVETPSGSGDRTVSLSLRGGLAPGPRGGFSVLVLDFLGGAVSALLGRLGPAPSSGGLLFIMLARLGL